MDRKDELKIKRSAHVKTLEEIKNWLLSHTDHPDRSKYFSDKAWHELEIQRIDVKIKNLNAGIPENGYSSDIENNNLNQKIINNTSR
jgi:hypothetical protein